MTAESAEILGLQALAWLAGDEAALERFMAASGADLASLRAAAGRPETGLAIFDFLLANEDLLLAFCDSASVQPQALHLARHRLGGDG